MSEIQIAKREKREKGIHEVYMISIGLKGAFALLQIVLGLMLLYTKSVVEFILELVQNELIEDPNDFFATHFRSILNPSPEAQVFGGLYLLSHGAIKLVLIVGLLRNKLWAYPASLAVFALFILYQMIRYFRTYSVWLLVLTVLDLIVMWLIWHEYRRALKSAEQKQV